MTTQSTKILFVIGSLELGGSEKHLSLIIPSLVKSGFDVTLITFIKGKLAPIIEESGARVIESLPNTALCRYPSFLRAIARYFLFCMHYIFLLIQWRPSVVHFFLPRTYILGSLLNFIPGKRILIMSRRSLSNYQQENPILARIERCLHYKMDAVIANSEAVIRDLRKEGVAEDRLGLIYNGIEFEQFKNIPLRSSVRKSLGIGENTFLIVCVANLIWYKGHHDLIAALNSIKELLPTDWSILIVGGDSGIQARLQSFAEECGMTKYIHWLGVRTDIPEIYSAADIGVLCSHQEGFSNSVLEGMASGLTMIVTDVGGNAEAVIDGESGIVVPPKNPEAIGKAILALAFDEARRTKMGALASSRARHHFSLEACVNRYVKLYNSLLHNSDLKVKDIIDSVSP